MYVIMPGSGKGIVVPETFRQFLLAVKIRVPHACSHGAVHGYRDGAAGQHDDGSWEDFQKEVTHPVFLMRADVFHGECPNP